MFSEIYMLLAGAGAAKALRALPHGVVHAALLHHGGVLRPMLLTQMLSEERGVALTRAPGSARRQRLEPKWLLL